MKKTILGLLAAVSMAATSAIAADKGPAIVFDLGGKFDKSFNQSAYNGAEKFTKDSGIKYRGLEIQNASQRCPKGLPSYGVACLRQAVGR